MPNFSNFTPRAQQVIQLAKKEADRFNHPYVGTEHILLGLIALGEGVAVNVLDRMDVDVDTVRVLEIDAVEIVLVAGLPAGPHTEAERLCRRATHVPVHDVEVVHVLLDDVITRHLGEADPVGAGV